MGLHACWKALSNSNIVCGGPAKKDYFALYCLYIGTVKEDSFALYCLDIHFASILPCMLNEHE